MEQAVALRAELLARGAGLAPDAGETPQQVLHALSGRRLLGSIVLSVSMWGRVRAVIGRDTLPRWMSRRTTVAPGANGVPVPGGGPRHLPGAQPAGPDPCPGSRRSPAIETHFGSLRRFTTKGVGAR